MDQAAPSHDSARVTLSPAASVSYPTAVQPDGPMQSTASRVLNPAPDGDGLGTRLHFDPFHATVSVALGVNGFVDQLPTAKQAAGPEHETPIRKFSRAPVGLGLGTRDQWPPCHASVNVRAAFLVLTKYPTAAHRPAAQDTAESSEDLIPAGFGVLNSVHVEPFHPSAKVTGVPAGSSPVPTAMHPDAWHDTPLKWA